LVENSMNNTLLQSLTIFKEVASMRSLKINPFDTFSSQK